MSDPGSLIPMSDPQAKAIEQALKVLQGIGGFLRDTLGTIPEDVIGLLGGDWLKVRRAENLASVAAKARGRLNKRGIKVAEPASLSIVLPLLTAAADESRDELQEIWARLLAAAADPARAKSFRIAFIEAAKKMDPLDAAVLEAGQQQHAGNFIVQNREALKEQLQRSRDEIDISIWNLEKLELAQKTNPLDSVISPFGREFLRAIQD